MPTTNLFEKNFQSNDRGIVSKYPSQRYYFLVKVMTKAKQATIHGEVIPLLLFVYATWFD
jgi:hypothetical protein